MNSVDLQVLNSVLTWRKDGHAVDLFTVIETWGSAPRPPGAMLAIRDDGQVAGSVSGGCVEDDLLEKVRNKSFAGSTPEFLVYGVSQEEAARFGLPCGDDVVLEFKLDNHSAVVALTHDPKLDDMVLLEALKSPAFYVGALGSRRNTAARRERLKLFDLDDTQIDRLHGPIGLRIGSRTPPEIAISILAELTAVKHGFPLENVTDKTVANV